MFKHTEKMNHSVLLLAKAPNLLKYTSIFYKKLRNWASTSTEASYEFLKGFVTVFGFMSCSLVNVLKQCSLKPSNMT